MNKLVIGLIAALIVAFGIAGFLYLQMQDKEKEVAAAANRQAAQEKLDQMMRQKQWQAEQVESARAWAAQRQAQMDEQAAVEAAKPHYTPDRLAHAAKPRTWATITVPDLNIKAALNTMWQDGQLYYRVALLGQPYALETFTRGYSRYHLTFADQSGAQILEITVNPQDFVRDPPSVNGGIPTMEVNDNVECDLPRYELSIQWNLVWDQ